MKCAIYKSSRKPNTYLYVERADDFSRVPAGLISLLGKLEFVMTLDLAQRKLAQADPTEVCEQLKVRGFYLQLPPGDVQTVPS